MIGGVVEVAENGRHVSVYRGFMKVEQAGQELGRVALDDIKALVLSAQQITLSRQLLAELADRKAVVVTTGRNWHPVALTLPYGAHYGAGGIIHDQIAASKPLKKRLWQQLVREKIANQATVLGWHAPAHPKGAELAVLLRQVRSGDPDNREAQAARHYWPALMGDDFRRDRDADDGNKFLNYGYTVLRAATARAVCAAGLHPALGLHHFNRLNAFSLVDDLMEPFRPLVDNLVRNLVNGGETSLNPDNKRYLVAVLRQDLISGKGASPLVNCLIRLAQSLTACLSNDAPRLELPELRQPGQLL